jgi:predicted permease
LIHSVDAEPVFQQIVIDWHEVAFVAVLAVVSPLVFSLAPALAAIRVNLTGTLNASSARTIGAGRRGRELLVTTQLALAIALAVVGGLVVRTAAAMVSAPSGFQSSGVLTFGLALDQRASNAPDRRAMLRELSGRLAAEANLAVGILDSLPATISEPMVTIEPDVPRDGQSEAWAHVITIDDGTLKTLHVPLLEGRSFTPRDIEADAAVMLVSLETSKRYFGGPRNALGRRVTIRRDGAPFQYEVVGVTGDVRNTIPENGMPPRVWVPMSNPATVTFVARTPGDTRTAVATIRRIVRELLPGVPLETLETYDQAIARRDGGNFVAMGMLISFAVVALLFATTGLYGTVALSADLRRAEFATRFALGARVTDVAALVIGQAARLLLVAGAFGLTAGFLAANAMRRLLFGISPLDPLNLLVVVSVLGIVTLAASIAPALRAARIDVIQAIRAQ